MTTSEVAARIQGIRQKYTHLVVRLLAQAGDLPGLELEPKIGVVHEQDLLAAVPRCRAYKARRPKCTWEEAARRVV